MKQFDAEILVHRELAEDYFELELRWPRDVRKPFPGQIVTVLVERNFTPFLRRPFALSKYDGVNSTVGIIYHRRGPATKALSTKKVGETLDLLGPRGFYFQPGKEKNALLVGGGIGTGPILFAANWLASKGYKPRLILGFRTQALVPTLELAPEIELQLCTEDGSTGFRGNVVQYLETLPAEQTRDAFVWTCGPYPMLKAVHYWSSARKIPCKVSMEEIMACGVGACVGCTVETTDDRETIRVCTEGPVIASEVIRWN